MPKSQNKNHIEAKPVIFWYSDPICPDETVVVSGGGFLKESIIELFYLKDDEEVPEPDNLEFKIKTEEWTSIGPIQRSEHSLKAIIPANWKQGIFACRVRNGKQTSNIVFLNFPDSWWFQGDGGLSAARAGGWLRIMGKSLDFSGKSIVCLRAADGSITKLNPESMTCYNLFLKIPGTLNKGKYEILVHNGYGGSFGYKNIGILNVLDAKVEDKYVLNVLDYGADPLGKKDSTVAIVSCAGKLASLGGGVIFFPRGRYRIDSKHRAHMWLDTPLKVNSGTTLRGESADLVSLWWPDRDEPLPSLIEGGNDFAVENMTIYTQGKHRNIITGENNVRISQVRIRANCFYMCRANGATHHNRGIDEIPGKTGAAIELWGHNNWVSDCDIYHPGLGFRLKNPQGTTVRNNTICAGRMVSIGGADGLIFENNIFQANTLDAGGNDINVYFGITCRHVYYAHNHVSHIYGVDRENLTFDGHGTAYIGKIAEVEGLKVTLKGKPVLGRGERDAMPSIHDATIYIIHGKGIGQYRHLTNYAGNRLEIDKPWDVMPDKESLVSIGAFNGRHLIIGNTGQDTGTLVQLYPPNCECIVAKNQAVRASNINSLSRLGRNERSNFHRVEPSWYNQFLDNHIVVGNGWGGGGTEIDRWIGGETSLNIWGWQLSFSEYTDYSQDSDRPLTEEDLIAILGYNPNPGKSIPLSLFQIVRRHKIDNNSFIRIRGAVSDALVENCIIKDSFKGISIESAIEWEYTPATVGPLDFEPEPAVQNIRPYLSPKLVLLRNNHFHRVENPYSGDKLKNNKKDQSIIILMKGREDMNEKDHQFRVQK